MGVDWKTFDENGELCYAFAVVDVVIVEAEFADLESKLPHRIPLWREITKNERERMNHIFSSNIVLCLE